MKIFSLGSRTNPETLLRNLYRYLSGNPNETVMVQVATATNDILLDDGPLQTPYERFFMLVTPNQQVQTAALTMQIPGWYDNSNGMYCFTISLRPKTQHKLPHVPQLATPAQNESPHEYA